jgi:hypothetical protein
VGVDLGASDSTSTFSFTARRITTVMAGRFTPLSLSTIAVVLAFHHGDDDDGGGTV